MNLHKPHPLWTVAAPLVGWVGVGLGAAVDGPLFLGLLAVALFWNVLAGVHHAEVVAHRVGEPFGALVLALAVTVIEVSLIVSLMASGGPDASFLARDTVFAALMIIMTGMLGACLFIGGLKRRELNFITQGVSGAMTVLVAISVLALILPNYTVSAPGPTFSRGQLVFIALTSLFLYGVFVFSQSFRHRDHFIDAPPVESNASGTPTTKQALVAAGLMVACLGSVVLLAKQLAPTIEAAAASLGAPKSLVGVVIAAVVLLPEGLSAVRAALADRLQTSLNLALGSAIASICLTIPAVAVVSLVTGMELSLGIDPKSTVLYVLSLYVSVLALRTGVTTMLQGAVLLVIFGVYLVTTILP